LAGALAAGLILFVGLLYYFDAASSNVLGVDGGRFVAANADLSQVGVDVTGAVARDDDEPLIDQQDYQQIIAKLSPGLSGSVTSADALALATRAALSARFFDDAVGYGQRWVAIAADNPDAFNALGLAQFQRGRFEGALASFEKAVVLSPRSPAFLLNAAMAADQTDDVAKTVRYLRTFVQLAPAHPRIEDVKKWLVRLEKAEQSHGLGQ
jgi:tetratricopeptide (TPR) repeat protein